MRPLRVFLCHSAKDKSVVRELYQKLRTETWIDPWLDEEKLLPGQDWHEEIEKAVEVTDVVIVLLSKQSVSQEGFVHRELKLALDVADEKPESTIFIIPLRLDDCPVPRRLRDWHYVDYFPIHQKNLAFERLIASLKLRAQSLDLSVDVPLPAPKKSPRLNPRLLWIGGIVFFILILGGLGLNYLFNNLPAPTATISPAYTVTPKPPTSTPTRTPSPMPTLGIGSTMTGEHGETLVYVPAGEFRMGSENGEDDEKPAHTVYLDAFWIDQTEVTNKQYQTCVVAGVCEPPTSTNSYTRLNYYGNPDFDNYPVLHVNWNKANRYCEVWTDGYLPTEAQWEKAARGPDGRIYPWGNNAPSKDLLNYNQNVGDTTAVKSYPNTTSFYGTYDMAGNVLEWVNDWYDETYYQKSPSSNPLGPNSGKYRVLRGGSWSGDFYDVVHSTSRFKSAPGTTDYGFGFRCARSP